MPLSVIIALGVIVVLTLVCLWFDMLRKCITPKPLCQVCSRRDNCPDAGSNPMFTKVFVSFAVVIVSLAFVINFLFGFICVVATALITSALHAEGAFQKPTLN